MIYKIKGLEIDFALFKKATLAFKALNHKMRQQFLQYIDEKGELTVTEIYVKFYLEQSIASQHLALLRKQGFVKTRRDGKKIYYSINYDGLGMAHSYAVGLVKIKNS